MIRYALSCEKDHEFDGWFSSSEGFEAQAAAGDVLCPWCGSTDIRKALMAPSIGKNGGKGSVAKAGNTAPNEIAREMSKAMRALKAHVEKNFDYVGGQFADEARRIHYGETETRGQGIYGEATPDEARELIEEGVEVAPLPVMPRSRTN
ncbi:MAG: DUF1178 domain-containing protein [Alphaproteobacteria bacterium HGW-Alphaproteobacteria-12]|nr:MAG: DUF1178 domain-containing protein [Alphaproteobacteria bacterium HGW-Alphaproteobacteria-12]